MAGVSLHAPNFYDSAAAEADWRLCAHVIAGRPAQRVMVRRNGRATYPATSQRPLSGTPPAAPAAVMLWDDQQHLSVLALDFDAKNGHGPRTVAADASAALQLLARVGLHPFADRSPVGGWHVYAPLPTPQPADEVLLVVTALARRLSSLDVGPLTNPLHGCIRPPGSAHKSGGFQRLVHSQHEVVLALTSQPRPNAWTQLRQELVEELRATPPPGHAVDSRAPGGIRRRRIAQAAEQLAVTGLHPDRTFSSPSEARFSVICHAVNAGMTLADVHCALRDRWTWLRTSYGTKHHSALVRDFTKAKQQRTTTLLSRHVRQSDTSLQHTQRGAPSRPELDVHLALRRFRTFATHHSRTAGYSPTLRAVLTSLLWAGHVQGRILINTGIRSLAEQAGVHYDTVASMLHDLARDGLITRISRAHGPDADVWRINVELATQHPPAFGRASGLRRVFRVIGGHLVAEVYESLPHSPSVELPSSRDLANELSYDRRRVHEALRVLAGWGLAEQVSGRWHRGPADPQALSHQLGGEDDWAAQHAAHLRQRRAWAARLRHLHATIPRRVHGQLQWEAEFDLVEPQDSWVEDFAGGSPPQGHSQLDQAVLSLVRTALGGVVVA